MKKIILTAITAVFCLMVLAVPLAATVSAQSPTDGLSEAAQEAAEAQQGASDAADAAADVATRSSAEQAVCEGIGMTAGTNGCAAAPGQRDLASTIRTAIGVLSLVIGIVSVIMIMIGGFKYITSSGDSAKVNSAKDTILYAIIGIVVASLAQVIVRFVLTKT